MAFFLAHLPEYLVNCQFDLPPDATPGDIAEYLNAEPERGETGALWVAPPLPPGWAKADAAAWVAEFPDAPAACVKAVALTFPHTAPATFRRWLGIADLSGGNAPHPRLAADPARCSLLPLADPEMFEFRKTIERLHWTPEEVDLSGDAPHFAAAGPAEQRLVAAVLGFFGCADELVVDQLEHAIGDLIQCKEGEFYLHAQANQECVHSEAYSLQIQDILPRGAHAEVFDAMAASPHVGRMADWVRWWSVGLHADGDVFAAMACVEGVMFSGFFAALQYFKSLNVLPGMTALNEFICRDEGVHTLFWCFVVTQRLARAPAPAAVAAIAAETVRLSAEFFDDALAEPLPGLNAALMRQYIESVADSVLGQLGCPPAYGAENPLPFMDMLALNHVAKINGFEHTATQYQNLSADSLDFAIDDSPIDGEL